MDLSGEIPQHVLTEVAPLMVDSKIPDADAQLERNVALLREYLTEAEAREAEAVLRRMHAERPHMTGREAVLQRFIQSAQKQTYRGG